MMVGKGMECTDYTRAFRGLKITGLYVYDVIERVGFSNLA